MTEQLNYESLKKLDQVDESYLEKLPEPDREYLVEYAEKHPSITPAVAGILYHSENFSQDAIADELNISNVSVRNGLDKLYNLGFRPKIDFEDSEEYLEDIPEDYQQFMMEVLSRKHDWSVKGLVGAVHKITNGSDVENLSGQLNIQKSAIENKLEKIEIYTILKEEFEGSISELVDEIIQRDSAFAREKFQFETIYGEKVNKFDAAHKFQEYDIELTENGNIAGSGESIHRALRAARDQGFDLKKVSNSIEKIQNQIEPRDEQVIGLNELGEQLEEGKNPREVLDQLLD